jgi:hypothetical protein
MQNTILLSIFFIYFFNLDYVRSRESLLVVRNNFLRYCFKVENRRLQKILYNLSNNLYFIHCKSLEKYYDISYKYYALTENEKELLEAVMFFV